MNTTMAYCFSGNTRRLYDGLMVPPLCLMYLRFPFSIRPNLRLQSNELWGIFTIKHTLYLQHTYAAVYNTYPSELYEESIYEKGVEQKIKITTAPYK